MQDIISHSGTIDRITHDRIFVRIDQVSACASCSVSGHCNASEHQEKLIEVMSSAASTYRVGEVVNVEADSRVGHQAVLWAFGIPLVLMIASVLMAHYLVANDAMGALLSLGILIPYYICIYLFRDRLRDRLAFRIVRK